MFVALCIRENLARHVFYFALSSALLSGWLMLDDLFLIHEDLANRYLGIGEKSVLAALGTFVFAYLVAFSRTILRTNYSNLAIAFVFLAASVVIDVLLEKWVERLGPWTVFVEDGLKWIGICFWCAYHAATARQLLAESCLASTRAATNRAGP
ncbi:MAG: hypothetical protein EAZ21_12845 [Betaproteobacteria bacterium]|nr:MAG: hypothetical protein EAZ21_12845 [Betaproteobacteria bacterium]